jgi:hypothetical protein
MTENAKPARSEECPSWCELPNELEHDDGGGRYLHAHGRSTDRLDVELTQAAGEPARITVSTAEYPVESLTFAATDAGPLAELLAEMARLAEPQSGAGQPAASRINREMALDDYECTLRLLADIRGLIQAQNLSEATKLHAIDNAITEAVGGSVENARDFVRDVTLGLLEDSG